MANINQQKFQKFSGNNSKGYRPELNSKKLELLLEVGDGIARIYGLSNVESNELIQFENGMEAIVLNLEEDNVGAGIACPTEEINEG